MNKNIKDMTSFIVMDVLAKANELQNKGIDVIHLEVGEPDFNVPKCVIDAEIDALKNNDTHYTHALGLPELRQEISNFYYKEYGVIVDPECIVVTSGSSPAILMTMLTLCDVDSEVILSNPGYACYRNFTIAAHAKPISLNLTSDNKFEFSANDVKKLITDKTEAIFINSPMNPTGQLLSGKFMKELSEFNIPIISDEIYHGLVYQGKVHSILEYTKNAFVVNGFSKRFAMTGLRLGYVIAPKEYMPALEKLQQNLFICAPSSTQRAGIAALTGSKEEVERMRDTYAKRRLYVLSRLEKMGLSPAVKPSGAFYIFVDVSRFTKDCYKFTFDILDKAHVGVTPGVDFGTMGEGYIRLSYANSLENLKEGMDRLEIYFSNLKCID